MPELSPPDAGADAAAFEEWRPLLFGIAYRMLGSGADAEDIVQDASIRWLRRSDDVVESVRAYLVTIVTRLCLDQLDSARSRRVTYAGPWLPEPVVVEEEEAAEQADSLSLAFLVLLEELTPLERAAYLLHDIFGYSFEEVAGSLGGLRPPVASSGRGHGNGSSSGANASTPTCVRGAPWWTAFSWPAPPGTSRGSCPCSPTMLSSGPTVVAKCAPPCARWSVRSAARDSC